MARCLGADPPYGCKHFKEHQEAARKGWRTRRHGVAFRGTDEHRSLSTLFGEEITHAHEHPEHRGTVRYKRRGKWYELPKGEFKRLAGEGKKLEREQERTKRQRAREEARQEAEYQKESLRLEKIGASEKARKARQAEREARQEQHIHEDQERQVSAARRAEHAEIIKRLRAMGGIRPNRLSSTSGKTKPPEYEEWQELPPQVRTNDPHGSKGVPLDEAAATLAEEYPELKIETGGDLQNYLRNERLYRQRQHGLRRGRAA